MDFPLLQSKAIYIRLVDMKCPLVVVILIYTHLMQVCWIVTLWEVSRLITQPLIISIVTETCTSFDCIAIRIDHVSQPNIYSLVNWWKIAWWKFDCLILAWWWIGSSTPWTSFARFCHPKPDMWKYRLTVLIKTHTCTSNVKYFFMFLMIITR